MASIFLLAGENSGDKLGGAIAAALKQRAPEVHCWGVGGNAMQAAGMETVEPMDQFTAFGLGEALKAIPRLNRLANSLIDQIMDRRPTAILTIDNKGFSLRFARRLRKRMQAEGWHAPILHLVAPTVWAWGAWRAKSVAASVDHLLCLFPMEPALFNRHGVATTLVGHPAAEKQFPSRPEARKALGLADEPRALVLLPGSRKREITTLLPDMLAAAALLRKDDPDLEILLPVAASVRGLVEPHVAEGMCIRVLDQDQLDLALVAGDYGFICSGTVTLETALAGLPGAVFYRADALTTLVGKWLVKRDSIVLPNVISGAAIYPFYFNREFSPETMAAEARDMLSGKKQPWPGALREQLQVGQGFAVSVADAILAAARGD